MMRRMILVALGLAAVALVTVSLHAQEAGQPSPQPKDPPEVSKNKDKLSLEEQKLAEKFDMFQLQLIQLKGKLEKGTEEEREYAKVLEKVIDYSKGKGIDIQFKAMVEVLNKGKLTGPTSLKEALKQSSDLTKELETILALLKQSRDLGDLQAEYKKYENLLKEIEHIILKQEIIQAKTQIHANSGTDPKNTKTDQGDLAKKTGDLAKSLDKSGDKGNGQNGPSEIAKSSDKSNNKGEGQVADGKDVAKPGNNKEPGKDGPKSDGDQGKAKGGDGQEKTGMGDPKEAEPGKGKDAGKDSPKDGQGGAKGADGMKMGDRPPGGAKSGDGMKMGGEQPGGAKGDGQKMGDGMKGGPKDASGSKSGGEGQKGSQGGKDAPKDAAGSKGGQGSPMGGEKGGAKSDGQKMGDMPPPNADKGKAEPKNASKGDEGKAKGGDKGDQGSPKAGGQKGGDPKSGGQGSPQGGAKGDGKKGGDSGGGGGKDKGGDKGPMDQAKKQIEDANHYMKKAEDDLAKKDPQGALDPEKKALDELNKIKKKIEDILKQLREEEIERTLAALQLRCEHMLIMQIEVRENTVAIGEVVKKNNNKVDELQKGLSLKQASKEKEIIKEADLAIKMLESEGTAVAFPEVFKQIKTDMELVADRLEKADVGDITVAIEDDIISTLQDMVNALKEAREENKKKKDKKKKDGDGKGGGGKKEDPLVKLLFELKLIKSQQMIINNRTKTYATKLQGEQVNNPAITQHLQKLMEDQAKLFEITKKLAKGDNK